MAGTPDQFLPGPRGPRQVFVPGSLGYHKLITASVEDLLAFAINAEQLATSGELVNPRAAHAWAATLLNYAIGVDSHQIKQ